MLAIAKAIFINPQLGTPSFHQLGLGLVVDILTASFSKLSLSANASTLGRAFLSGPPLVVGLAIFSWNLRICSHMGLDYAE